MLSYNSCAFSLATTLGETISITENNILLVNMYTFMSSLSYISIIINHQISI
ncbi:Uncharacterised protein [Shigella sonnei]|nr:Uncharacterised protein [Shigella sonnei]